MSSFPMVKLAEVAEISGGITKNAKRSALPIQRPYLSVANVAFNRIDTANLNSIGVNEGEIPRAELMPGDLMVVEGNGSLSQLGRVAIWQGQVPGCLHQNHLIKVRSKPTVKPKWLLYWLMSSAGRKAIEATASSTSGLHTLSLAKVGSLPAPIASLEEQGAAIAYIELHLSRLDETVTTLRAVQVKLKQARASILKAAVEGRLVPTEAELARREKRDYEPASLLLKRILCSRENSFRAARQPFNNKVRYPMPSRPHQGSDYFAPEGWTIATLDQLADYFNLSFIGQGWSPRCLRREARKSEWCVMKTTAIQPMRFDPSSNKALPKELDPRPDLELTSGDLLVTRAGPRTRVGICCLVGETRSKVMLCDKAYRIRPSKLCIGKYLEIALNSCRIERDIDKLKTGINDSGVNITQSGFLNLLIPLAPFSEQQRIVAEVDRRFSVLDQVEYTVEASMARCAKLRQAILKRAYEGRLWPTG